MAFRVYLGVMAKFKKTKTRVVLKTEDLLDIVNIENALACARGVDKNTGEEFTGDLYLWVSDDMKFPVHSDSAGGVVGWFRWDKAVYDDLFFYPNKYVEVRVDEV